MARRDYYDDPEAPLPNSIVPAVTVAVRDQDGRLLLIQRSDNGLWAMPGGGLEVGETVAQAAAREVLEETGIAVEIDGVVGIYSDPKHVIAYDDGEVRQQFAICLSARPAGGTLQTSSETVQVRWVEAKDLDELPLHSTIRLRIRHALDPERTAPYVE